MTDRPCRQVAQACAERLSSRRAGRKTVAWFVILTSLGCSPMSIASELDERFSRAMEWRERGHSFKAITHFEAVLLERPDSDRVRAELALAYLDAGEHELAMSLVNELLKKPALPSPVRVNLAALRKKIGRANTAAQRQLSVWRRSLSIGPGYDDNVSLASQEYFDPGFFQTDGFDPDPGSMLPPGADGDVGFFLPGLPYFAPVRPREDTFFEGRIRLGFSHRNRRATNWFGRPVLAGWQLSSDLRIRQYDQYSAQDQNTFRLRLSPSLSWRGGHLAAVDFAYQRQRRGGDPLASYILVRPQIKYKIGIHDVQLGLEFSNIDYLQSQLFAYPDRRTEFFVRYRHRWSSSLRTVIGARKRDRQGGSAQFGYGSMQYEFSLDYLVNEKLLFSALYDHREYDFADEEFGYTLPGIDVEPIIDLGLLMPSNGRHDVRDGLRLLAVYRLSNQWSAIVRVEYSSNRSTLEEKQYNRSLSSLKLRFQF